VRATGCKRVSQDFAGYHPLTLSAPCPIQHEKVVLNKQGGTADAFSAFVPAQGRMLFVYIQGPTCSIKDKEDSI